MKALHLVMNGIDTFNEWVGRGVSWVTFGLVGVVFVDVVMRYLFNITFVFVQELEWHIFAFIFLIGAGYTLLHDQHVRVDIFYQKLEKKTQAWVNLAGAILFLLPGCYLVLYTSIPWVITAFEINEMSPDPGGVPMRYIAKSFLPIGFAFLLLQGISLALKSVLYLMEESFDSIE